ncbi:MAG: dTDP-4-dehydrorhamnose 3,5-epimerase [Spirochaetae bacterium HGW-Spirochaetae-5]|nr:MAG: dTDP-4-dehydrorhamnose 3,5-epimerase [Spirochaetae bacterium HGW-Spirochaetae-5]
MPFTFKQLDIPGLVLVTPKAFSDSRGFFLETYKKSDFKNSGIDTEFMQDNHSLSSKGVLRGLHYQKEPYSQAKLVRVIKGSVYDVAVDIRKSSPTFKQWIAVELSDENNNMLYIPEGFAHGFTALADDVHLVYKCSSEYSHQYDAGIRWDDPEINIQWPFKNPSISDKDLVLPYLKDAEVFI